ncbi:LysR family transcriptional regulator [Shewanella ulleungensis]|jgi:DNA-binding transcriptional LysR family regulator|uniref:LysR family transcriptional regulator n=1 Tax=Shewanella ulleungensis TaxID=2282699 RepID=A0ABQ2QS88_9GAMM|nr:LysR family transcriptional regulator [Shewanella ulleungensis]MCL1151658.1 LysR family transcriptional regulator [Shewanella ulleungensis]GGP90217.1 LysR family transcriptional regulator [Shewanella ulleungensis]
MLLEDLQVVIKVAEFRSITAAATNLDMRTATASAALKRVEAHLGAELFIRTTRQLRLSSAGEKYIPQCEQAMLMLEQAKQNMKGELDIIDGDLRLSVSSDLGRNVVIPWIDDFMDTHAKVSLRVSISDTNVDFYRDSVDLALRYGSPNDANLYGFKICNVPRLICASQAYLDKYGTPKHPQDLAEHNALLYQLQNLTHDIWEFTQGDDSIKVKVSGNRVANDADLVRRWCVNGKGIAAKSCLDMAHDLLTNNLVTIMSDYQVKTTELWLIFPSRQSITPATRLLRDMLKQQTRKLLQQLIAKGILDKSVLD